MASRMIDKFRGTFGKERVDITGSFQTNGAATTVLNQKGNGFSVAHTAATAQYVVTLQDMYFDYDSCWCEMSGPNPGIQCQIIGEPDVKVAKQFTIQLYDTSTKGSGSQADLAFNANVRVHFGIRVKNTSGNF